MEAGTIIRESKEYIEKHIDEALTVAKIAGAVGYSEYHFSRIFRKETGVSVMEYVKSENSEGRPKRYGMEQRLWMQL